MNRHTHRTASIAAVVADQGNVFGRHLQPLAGRTDATVQSDTQRAIGTFAG